MRKEKKELISYRKKIQGHRDKCEIIYSKIHNISKKDINWKHCEQKHFNNNESLFGNSKKFKTKDLVGMSLEQHWENMLGSLYRTLNCINIQIKTLKNTIKNKEQMYFHKNGGLMFCDDHTNNIIYGDNVKMFFNDKHYLKCYLIVMDSPMMISIRDKTIEGICNHYVVCMGENNKWNLFGGFHDDIYKFSKNSLAHKVNEMLNNKENPEIVNDTAKKIAEIHSECISRTKN